MLHYRVFHGSSPKDASLQILSSRELLYTKGFLDVYPIWDYSFGCDILSHLGNMGIPEMAPRILEGAPKNSRGGPYLISM